MNDNELLTGHTGEELRAAFALVKPAGNWKMPVDAVIPAGTEREKRGTMPRALSTRHWLARFEYFRTGPDQVTLIQRVTAGPVSGRGKKIHVVLTSADLPALHQIIAHLENTRED